VERLSDTVRGELGRFGAPGDLAGIVEAWTGAVGEGIARNAWPSRVGRDGTLHVNTADSVWAFELSHRGSEIAERLGIAAIRFAPGPLASSDRPEPAPTHFQPSEEDLREAAGIAAGIADESLSKTVEKAVALSLASDRSDRSL